MNAGKEYIIKEEVNGSRNERTNERIDICIKEYRNEFKSMDRY